MCDGFINAFAGERLEYKIHDAVIGNNIYNGTHGEENTGKWSCAVFDYILMGVTVGFRKPNYDGLHRSSCIQGYTSSGR